MDDRQLLKEYIENGSEKAFAQITERHRRMVYATCLRELREAALAEDATQTVFLVLAHKARSLRNATALASWLFMISRNVSRRLLRQEHRRMRCEREAIQRTMAYDLPDRTWELISEFLNDAVATLKHSDREIILRRFYEGMSFKEAGEELQISENTARVRSMRAVDRLRRHLADAGVVVPAATLVSLLGAEAAKAMPSAMRCPPILDPRLHHLAQGVIKQVFLTNLKIAALIATIIAAGAVGVYTGHNRSATIHTTAVATADPSLIKLISGPAGDSNLAGSQILQECRQAYASVQTFQQDAQSSIGGQHATAHIVYQRPGNLRVSGTSLFAAVPPLSSKYDLICRGGSDDWVYNAGKWEQEVSAEMGVGAITGISGTAGTGVPALLLHDGGWGDVLAGLDEIDSVTTETIEGRDVYRVIGRVDNRSTTLWIDQKTFFLIRSRVLVQMRHRVIPITVTYSPPKIDEPIPANSFVR